VRDITNFLVYVGEPAQLHRKSYGIFVLLFLGLFAIIAYFLKKEFWKDVH
jgi:ubiquinol-cytochrome c reductase cytochrome c1 subunit